MDMVDYIIKKTEMYIKTMPKELRKKCGQFFTSKETAVFMAGLLDVPDKQEISILDPGAGSGILAVAAIERLQAVPTVKKIRVVCYETDDNVMKLLCSNLEWAKENSLKNVEFELVRANYILSQAEDYNHTLGATLEPQKYDLVIGNPPYMKISKYEPEALAMQDICSGAPNLYFLFAEMSLFNLKENGEMVYIIPRSWTSGMYFRKFRKKFLSECVIEHIHLFAKRNTVFDKENVLQEIVVVKVRKDNRIPDTIDVTTSEGNKDFSKATWLKVPYSDVVDNGENKYVYLVTNRQETEILSIMCQWKDTLPSIGLKMRTGLTVDFRNKNDLRDHAVDGAVPLFYSQHIKNGKVVFPIGRENEYLATEHDALLQKNANYLFVKRFTAKEEHRRLQCGIYLARKYPEYSMISTQNKINFIDGLNGLSECVVYGLYVLFNSTLYDYYYRIMNGSTQVNSTEVNTMPVPPLKIIELMGKQLIRTRDMSEAACDRILGGYL